MIYYQDTNLYYFRKPAGIPSTFGKEPSFLDKLLEFLSTSETEGGIIPIVQSLFAFFGKEKELGLLNRLDNETSGLLYFAKNPRVYREFKEMQTNFQLQKEYIAEVYGDIRQSETALKEGIRFPIAHHRFNPDRMVAITSENDIKKTKGTLHHLTTKIIEFQFSPSTNTSVLLMHIQKGIRHQIRVHLASIGFPICGDTLYSKSDHKHYPTLQLFSVGIKSLATPL